MTGLRAAISAVSRCLFTPLCGNTRNTYFAGECFGFSTKSISGKAKVLLNQKLRAKCFSIIFQFLNRLIGLSVVKDFRLKGVFLDFYISVQIKRKKLCDLKIQNAELLLLKVEVNFDIEDCTVT